MELTPIRYFVKLAEILNFTEAAKALFVTQSALSISIKQLEEELHCRLFERIGKKVFLTESGRIFHEYALQAISSIDNGIQKINADNNVYKGKLTIGVTFSMIELVNACVVKYTQKYPDVKLSVIMFTTVEEIMHHLQNNTIDIAVTYKPKRQHSSILSIDLVSTHLSAILGRSHPLADRRSLTLEELRHYSFVTLLKGTHTRTMTEHFFMKNKVAIVPQIEVNDTNLILNLVSSGHWYSILSPISVKKNYDCVAIPIEGRKATLLVSLLWMNGKNKMPLFQTMVDEMLRLFHDVPEQTGQNISQETGENQQNESVS